MSGVGKVIGTLVSPVAALLGGSLLKKPATPTPTLPQPVMQPRTNSLVSDALLARRGAAVNRRTPAGGAESSARPKKTYLGQ